MNERSSGRDPGEFSVDFSRILNGVLAEKPRVSRPTGRDIAIALNRSDTYVSERKNGLSAWTVDDVDVIAELIGTNGLDLTSEVLRRMEVDELARRRSLKPSEADATTEDLEEAADADTIENIEREQYEQEESP